ncbi:MAG: aspartate kinase [Tissierellia bacterium]|nr:aspartate kinase [Tissierellia bacterium]
MTSVVAKFGGSSLANSQQFKKVKAIIDGDPDKKYIVPSAPGRSHPEDQKVTDLLLLLFELINHQISYQEVLGVVKNRYREIVNHIGIDFDLDQEFDLISQALENKASREYISSRGEYLNARILASYLGYDFVDASQVIRFTEEGIFDEKASYEALAQMAQDHERAVIPGFYGMAPDGKIHTFSRGGSDLTGALVAKGVQARVYENWTDVSGMLAADPRIVDQPRTIRYITYGELRELSYSGASIFHDEAIFPVLDAGIPIKIKNTNAPEDPGTYIVSTIQEELDDYHITGIAGRKDFSVIEVQKVHMDKDLSFHRKIFSVFESNHIFIEHIPSSIDSLSLIVSDHELGGKKDQVFKELDTLCKPDSLSFRPGISLITVVGRNMINHVGISATIFSSLAQADVNILMIIQGASEMNVIIGVDTQDFEKAIQAIYAAFDSQADFK